MNEQKISERLGWLAHILATQRDNIADIMRQIKGIGVRAGTYMTLHSKFTRFMEQVSFEREKELDILHEIETVEQRHLDLKRRKLLRRASPQKITSPQTERAPENKEEKPRRISLLTLFGLLYLFSSKPIKHKNQDLTVD